MTDTPSQGGSAADPNASDQSAAWNGGMGERWLANHERLDHMLEPFGLAAMDALGDLSGANVLDVGCGTGETVAELARRVGPDGRVVGVDISAVLVERARSRFAGPTTDFRVADAGEDELGHGYTAVLSRFGMMFFADPVAAFGHIRASLVSGAGLSIVVWQPPGENEWVRVPLGAAGSILDLPGPPPPNTPGPFALADPDDVHSILRGAGFAEPDITEFRTKVHVGDDAADAAEFLLGVLPTGPLLDTMDADATAAVLDAVTTAIDAGGSVDLEGATWIVTARNP